MDFLSMLIKFLSGENQSSPLFDIIGKLTGDGLNFMELLSSDTFKNLFSAPNENKNPTDNESVGDYNRLYPVESFADREIVYALNSYLGG